MLVLGTIIFDPLHFLFKASRNWQNCRTVILSFNLILVMTTLHRLILINTVDNPCLPILNGQKRSLRCRVYKNSTGILTGFPFPLNQLRSRLGSAYPWLIYIAKEPLPFQRWRFSLHFDPTTTRIRITTRSTQARAHASTQTVYQPTT